jgi:hypothetical protein
MAQHPDTTGPVAIIHDRARHASSFQISGWRRGKPFVINGNVPVPLAASVSDKDAEDVISKEAVKMLLLELSQKL